MSKSSKLSTAIKAYNVSECVKDFDGVIVPNYCLTEDLSVWAILEVFTVADLEEWINFKEGYSDTYKEVNGFRPRFDYSKYTLSEWRKEYSTLKNDAESVAKWEKEQLECAIHSFKKSVTKIQRSGAKDFMTAICWMLQADNVNPRNRMEVETFFYDNHILHSDYGQSLIKRICPRR